MNIVTKISVSKVLYYNFLPLSVPRRHLLKKMLNSEDFTSGIYNKFVKKCFMWTTSIIIYDAASN